MPCALCRFTYKFWRGLTVFYYLDGTVTIIEKNLAVVDVGGVGYGCCASLNTLSHLETGKKCRLYTYCNVKEDAFDIYGFYTQHEKRSFEMLLSVSGVGPKAAISILSVTTPEGLALAIVNGDVKTITAASGVGKRIAERIILELKDKISKEAADISGTASALVISTGSSKYSEAAAALGVLGFTPAEVGAVLKKIDIDSLSVEDIIRQALKSSIK